MKTKSIGVNLFGLFFLILGLLWLNTIYQRSRILVSLKKVDITVKEPKITAADYQSLDKHMKSVFKGTSSDKNLAAVYINTFRTIAIAELICSLSYIVTGIALFRVYRFGRLLVFLTILLDVLLKVLIVTYHNFILLPIQNYYKTTNILQFYFKPIMGKFSQLSDYLSGFKLIQSDYLPYAILFSLYVVGTLTFFSRPGVVHHFSKKEIT